MCVGQVWCRGDPVKPQSGYNLKNVVPFTHGGVETARRKIREKKTLGEASKGAADTAANATRVAAAMASHLSPASETSGAPSQTGASWREAASAATWQAEVTRCSPNSCTICTHSNACPGIPSRYDY